jgi:hypothetical protein
MACSGGRVECASLLPGVAQNVSLQCAGVCARAHHPHRDAAFAACRARGHGARRRAHRRPAAGLRLAGLEACLSRQLAAGLGRPCLVLATCCGCLKPRPRFARLTCSAALRWTIALQTWFGQSTGIRDCRSKRRKHVPGAGKPDDPRPPPRTSGGVSSRGAKRLSSRPIIGQPSALQAREGCLEVTSRVPTRESAGPRSAQL